MRESFKKNNVVHKNVPYEQPKLEDFKVEEHEILLSEDEEIDQDRIDDIKAWDRKNGNNLKKTREMIQKARYSIEDYKRISKKFYIHDMRKEKVKQKKHVIGHNEIMKQLKRLYPHKRYKGKDIAEFARIYEDINKIGELSDFNINRISEMLKDPKISENRKQFLEDYLTLEVMSKKMKCTDSQNLWEKQIEKEFEQKRHDAILAAHYLKLKDYYKESNYEKFADVLMRNDSATHFGLDCIRHRINNNLSKEERIKIESARSAAKLKSQKLIEDGKVSEEEHLYAKLKRLKEAKFENLKNKEQKKLQLTDEAKKWFPRVQERYEDMIFVPPKRWDFDVELEKAKIREFAKRNDDVYTPIN